MAAIEQTCPRCRDQAGWSYPDPDGSLVDVNCKKCGSFRMTRQDLKEALQQMELENNEDRTPG